MALRPMQDTGGESGGIPRSRGDRSMVQSRLPVRVGGGVPALAASRRLRRRFRVSDGAPTLVSSDGAIGRANSQPPVSRASSLFHPLTFSSPLPPTSSHPYMHTASGHGHGHARARARSTHARTHARVVAGARHSRTGGTQTRAPPTTSSRPPSLPPSLPLARSLSLPLPLPLPSLSLAHSLSLSLAADVLRRSPTTPRAAREGVRVPGSFLAAAVRSQTPMRQPRIARSLARTHACTRRSKGHADDRQVLLRLLVISAEACRTENTDGRAEIKSPPRDRDTDRPMSTQMHP